MQTAAALNGKILMNCLLIKFVKFFPVKLMLHGTGGWCTTCSVIGNCSKYLLSCVTSLKNLDTQ